jgi:hypothetical protein
MRGRSRLALTHNRLKQRRAQHGGRGIPVPEELWTEVVKVTGSKGPAPRPERCGSIDHGSKHG